MEKSQELNTSCGIYLASQAKNGRVSGEIQDIIMKAFRAGWKGHQRKFNEAIREITENVGLEIVIRQRRTKEKIKD